MTAPARRGRDAGTIKSETIGPANGTEHRGAGAALAGQSSQQSTQQPAQQSLEHVTLDRLQAAHETLTRAVADLTNGDAWQRMLHTAARFHHYSPHNVLLITAQCPQAQAVAGYQTWKQLDRQVRKGEKGIAILAPVVRGRPDSPASPSPTGDAALQTLHGSGQGEPGVDTPTARRLAGFRVVHVFDISQTDGPPLPTQPAPELLDGQAPPGLLDALALQVQTEGYQLTFAPLAVPHPGLAGANGVTDYLARTVTVKPDLSDAQTVKTLAHELGHVLLHTPEHQLAGLTREQAEVEAESVAYVVGAAHGLDTSSYTIPYVTGWAGGDLDLVRATAERVLTAARRVLDAAQPAPSFALHDTDGGARTLDRVAARAVTGIASPGTSRQASPRISTAQRPTEPVTRESVQRTALEQTTAPQPGQEPTDRGRIIDLTDADRPAGDFSPRGTLHSATGPDQDRSRQRLPFLPSGERDGHDGHDGRDGQDERDLGPPNGLEARDPQRGWGREP